MSSNFLLHLDNVYMKECKCVQEYIFIRSVGCAPHAELRRSKSSSQLDDNSQVDKNCEKPMHAGTPSCEKVERHIATWTSKDAPVAVGTGNWAAAVR